MAKEVAALIKLQIKGGAANPSPPVGPALGAKGVNIMEFCKQFNARTQDKAGKVLACRDHRLRDKSFDFVIKTPPAAVQIIDAAKIKGGSGVPHSQKGGQRHLGPGQGHRRGQDARPQLLHARTAP
jgi:large subunit ribosomal protein L11